MARDTGFPASDAQDDFLRARRRRALARLSAALRLHYAVDVMLSFDEVVEALRRTGERDLGLQTIALDSIVGSVDRRKDFDREFRPTSSRVRLRFERIADAQRRGASMPPIDVYRIGAMHFVRDGHHRVAVARAQGRETIDARVVEVVTGGGEGGLGVRISPAVVAEAASSRSRAQRERGEARERQLPSSSTRSHTQASPLEHEQRALSPPIARAAHAG